MQRGKGDIDKYKGQNQELARKHKEFEEVVNEMGRMSNINQKQLAQFRRQF